MTIRETHAIVQLYASINTHYLHSFKDQLSTLERKTNDSA